IPIFLRTDIICTSLYSVMSSPSTKIRPESGFSRPSTSLIIVDLPPPEPPRIIFVSPFITLKLSLFKIVRSSKNSTTSRNSMAGIMRSWLSTSAKVESAAFWLTGPAEGYRFDCVGEMDMTNQQWLICLHSQYVLQRSGEEEVGNDDHNRR